MNFKQWLSEATMTVYRGVGSQGWSEMRPSEGGVYGPGIYFYDNPMDAKAYSTPGGGIIVAEVDPDDPDVTVTEKEPVTVLGTDHVIRHRRIITVKDPNKVRIVDRIPNEEVE